jgi:enoyl-[acyl-carrier protein] reductase I
MAGLLSGKRGLIMGVANQKSIAFGIAKATAAEGAELAFTYQNEMMGKRVLPLAEELGSSITIINDVSEEGSAEKVMSQIATSWDSIDFVVHALAYADKEALVGNYMDVGRDAFLNSVLISAFSFTEIAKAARPMMKNGGSLVTMTYLGAQRTTPNYNVMGVAKATLEASVRYLAVDLGGENIRVNALSAGPVKTLAGSAIGGARHVFRHSETHAPLNRNPDMDEVGRAGLYLISDLSSGVTGEIHFVDGGYHHTGVPREVK